MPIPSVLLTNTSNSGSIFEATKTGVNATVAKKLIARDMLTYMDLKEKTGEVEAKITSYNILKQSLKFLKDASDKVRGMYSKVMSSESSDSSFVTATANFYAASNNYNIQIKSLAQSHIIQSDVFADKTSPVAVGTSPQYLKITVNDTSSVVQIITDTSDAGFNNTLEGIASAIEASNPKVSASVQEVFKFTASDNSLKFKVGSEEFTATISEGIYKSSEVAKTIQTALNNAYGEDSFTVTYDTDNKQFTITNLTGQPVTMFFDDPASTASSKLGFVGTSLLDNNEAVSSASSASAQYTLEITSKALGEANRIKIQVNETENNFDPDGGYSESGANTDSIGLSRLAFNPTYDTAGNVSGGVANMTQSQSATNAVFKINGKEYTRSINNVSDVVMGVTFNLLKADPNYDTNPKTIKLAITPMMLSINVSNLINNINSVNTIIQSQKGTADQPGSFDDEQTIANLQSEIRNIVRLNSADFAKIGITVDIKGKLTFDPTKFKEAVLADSKEVSRISMLLAHRYGRFADKYENSEIPKRTEDLSDESTKLNKQQDRLYAQIKLKELIANPPPVPAEQIMKSQQYESPILNLIQNSSKALLNRPKRRV